MLIFLLLLLECDPNVLPYRELTTVCDILKAFGFIFPTNGRRYNPNVLLITANNFRAIGFVAMESEF